MRFLLVLVVFLLPLVANAKTVYVCWANPTPKAKKECKSKSRCNGAGTYAWHKKKSVAKRLAIRGCEKEFGRKNCEIDYCDRQGIR